MRKLTIVILQQFIKKTMSKFCEICGKGPSSGNNVSHSVRRTKRRFLPNLIKKRIWDPIKKMFTKVKICMKCLRTSRKTDKKAEILLQKTEPEMA